MSTKVYKDALTKLCNERFGKVLANFSEPNTLKGRGKLGRLHAKRLTSVGGLTQANKTNNSTKSTTGDSTPVNSTYSAAPIS